MLSARRGQIATIAFGLLVLGGVLFTILGFQERADRHRRAQVAVEQLRTAAHTADAIAWEGTAVGASDDRVDQAVITRGFTVYASMNRAVTQFGELEPGADARLLQRDVRALFEAGVAAATAAESGGVEGGATTVRNLFRPALARLDRDGSAVSRRQAAIARGSMTRARVSTAVLTIGGFLLLVVLTWRVARLRRDVERAEDSREASRTNERVIQALLQHSSDVVMIVARDRTVKWHGASLSMLLGPQPTELTGQALVTLVHPEDRASLVHFIATAHVKTVRSTSDIRLRHADGTWLDVEVVASSRLDDPAVRGIVLNLRDVTARRQLERELRHRAFHDTLTGLANRALFEDRVAHARAGALRHGRTLAVMFLDLDDFKTINDSMGHGVGDALLRTMAGRLREQMRPVDTAARFGGDEFAILVEEIDEPGAAREVAERLLSCIATDIELAGRQVTLTGSIGIAVSSGHESVEELLRNADMAMYEAKNRGKNVVSMFEPRMYERAMDRLELGAELPAAISAGELELDYQPIVHLGTGRTVAVEALVRWNHPTRGRLAPDVFVGLAEETGAIIDMGRWILRSACRQGVCWHDALPRHRSLLISVNVSVKQLEEPTFVEELEEILQETGLRPSALMLEITESLLVDNREAMVTQLERLRALGVRLAVDDFGTGYSMLSHLQQFPLDILKIDKSFIDGIDDDKGKANLVKGIINLSESLDLQVIAEGIEQAGQARHLMAIASPLGQGFLFSRPERPETITLALSAQEGGRALQEALLLPPPDVLALPPAGAPAARDR